jgi:hypothetical protein
VDSPALM